MKKSSQEEMSGLNSVYRDIAELMGMDVANQFYNHFKGQQITFPSRFHDINFLHHSIQNEYARGSSIKELSVKYDYTERNIRIIVNEGRDEEE